MSEEPGEGEYQARGAQYAAYVDATERLVERRAEANHFYLGLNLAIVGAIGFMFSDSFSVISDAPTEWIVALFALAGCAVSFNWLTVILSQRAMLIAKFEILHALERKMPLQPFIDEWAIVSPAHKKVATARFEARLPSMFIVFFAVAVVASVAVWTAPCGLNVSCLTGRAAAPFFTDEAPAPLPQDQAQ